MNQNNRQPNEYVISHPGIYDIEVRLHGTSLNFKKLKPIKEEPKQKQKVGEAAQPGDDITENKNEEAGAAEKPKIIKTPENLLATGKYNFKDQNVALCFYADECDWSLVSITGLYDFNNIRINEGQFVEITDNDYVFNLKPGGKSKAKIFKLDTSKIDRHVLMKQFTVDVSYIFLGDVDMQLHCSKYTFDVPFFQQETRLKFKFLGHYPADSRIIKLYNHKFRLHPDLDQTEENLLREIDQYQRCKPTERTLGNTTQIIKYALNIEDLSSQDELKAFFLKNVRLDGMMTSYSFFIEREKFPPNFEEMSLCLVPMEKYVEGMFNIEDDSIYAQVEKVQNDRIFFEKKFPTNRHGITQSLNLNTTYFIRFVPNRITYRACFQALDSINIKLLSRYFDAFDDEPLLSKKNNGRMIEDFEWLNKKIETNEEQKSAVKNIVNCTAYPFPYVVFGPPGTGKTSLIVECIAQILKHKPASRIMVTAQSNSACDEVGDRLLKYVTPHKIFRFYSPSLLNTEKGETSEALRKTSNLRGKRNQYPTMEEFKHFNVVIVTLMSCSRLVQFDGIEMNHHFDYMFLDEAAAAMEPEAYVPIMGLGTDIQEITTNIVLLGDHKQLGAVVSSDIASRLGLSESLMERIMSKRRYRMNELDKLYDKNYVTQLLDNFRSHPAILQFSNVLFYESKLRAKVGEPEKSLGTRWNFLNNKKFPVLFHCVKTPSKIKHGGTSSYNEGEVKLVRFYVDLLLRVGIDGVKIIPDDIGVVSPYKAQLNKLRETLNHEKKIEIGTAEYYQGREKKIIIISTVKSRDYVGFLKSEKRLNVCITRAKSLLILIGNADTLQQNSLWNSFMHFCKANNGCCGEEFFLKQLTDKEQRILDELNSVFSELSTNESVDTQPAIDRAEELKAIEDRMEKLKILMKQM